METKLQCHRCGIKYHRPSWKSYIGRKYTFCSRKCYFSFRKESPESYTPHNKGKGMEEHPVLTKEKLQEMYTVQNLKMKEISQQLGFGYTTVHYWITKYKIPKKTSFDYRDYKSLDCTKRFILKERGDMCEKCGWNKAKCDVHHIIPQRDGGGHRPENLIILCPNHHRMADESKLKIQSELTGDCKKQAVKVYDNKKHVHECADAHQIVQYFCRKDRVIKERKKLMLITGHFLRYMGYAKTKGMPIAKLGSPKVKFYRDRFDIHVSW